MQINALIDVSLLLTRISELGFSGIDDASRACRVAPSTLKKLLSGQFPKIVAVRRVCDGLKIDMRELVISASKRKNMETISQKEDITIRSERKAGRRASYLA